MQNLFAALERPLPESLQEDLEELLTWDNNCYLTWVALDDDDTRAWRRFTVRLQTDGRSFGLTLDFGIPEWMDERGVEAILPASLSVSRVQGNRAVVELGYRPWTDLKASIPKVARTSARLMNELWGPTQSADVLLVGIDYQEGLHPAPFPTLPAYGG